jgi:hypothetical protein
LYGVCVAFLCVCVWLVCGLCVCVCACVRAETTVNKQSKHAERAGKRDRQGGIVQRGAYAYTLSLLFSRQEARTKFFYVVDGETGKRQVEVESSEASRPEAVCTAIARKEEKEVLLVRRHYSHDNQDEIFSDDDDKGRWGNSKDTPFFVRVGASSSSSS